jgi:hypothetical protein
MNYGPLFDAVEADYRADAGIAQASQPEQRRHLIRQARDVAESIAALRGRVTADDIVEWFDQYEHMRIDKILGNAMGGIFRDKRFYFTGEMTQSRRPERHSNYNRVWTIYKQGESRGA